MLLHKLGSTVCLMMLLAVASTSCGHHRGTEPDPEPGPCVPVEIDGSYDTISFATDRSPEIAIETDLGTMIFELWPDVAPIHCQSFVYLANACFYNGLTIHRVVPGFVIQGGDPNGNGTGGPGYTIPAEFSDKPHVEGTLSMARSNDPNSAGSQFFICIGRLQSLDGKYSVFGQLTEGLDVLHAIERVPLHSERPDTPVVLERVYLRNP